MTHVFKMSSTCLKGCNKQIKHNSTTHKTQTTQLNNGPRAIILAIKEAEIRRIKV
jgi:hypothetical protein